MRAWRIAVILAVTANAAPAASAEATLAQRGFHVYTSLCLSCHSLKYIRYRNLLALGIPAAAVDELRGKKRLDETLHSAMPNEIAQEYFGMVPPDLSLTAKARPAGADYVYELLTSYYQRQDGVYDNRVSPGSRMPDIFDSALSTSADEQQRIHERARDVAAFLAWSADPHAEERKALGVYVVAYFILLSLLLWRVKRKVWSRLK